MKTSKLRVTGLCAGNSPVTGEFPAQMASNAENVPFDDVIMESMDPVYKVDKSRVSNTDWIAARQIGWYIGDWCRGLWQYMVRFRKRK